MNADVTPEEFVAISHLLATNVPISRITRHVPMWKVERVQELIDEMEGRMRRVDRDPMAIRYVPAQREVYRPVTVDRTRLGNSTWRDGQQFEPVEESGMPFAVVLCIVALTILCIVALVALLVPATP